MQGQLEDAKCFGIAHDTIWCNRYYGGMVCATGADNEFGDAIDRIQVTICILGSKAFIDMVMTGKNKISVHGVEQIPEFLGIFIGTSAGTVQGNMPISHGAQVRVGSKVGLQPFVLRRSCTASASISAVRIQGDDMPGSNVETIVTLSNRAGSRAKVLEVARSPGIGGRTIRSAAG